MNGKPLVAAVLMLAFAAPAGAAPKVERERAPALSRLVDCRAIAAAADRLACYDREVAAVDQAVAKEELVVMDRQQVRKTRSSLFGLTLPNLGIFSDEKGEGEGISRIETTIRRASEDANGKWVLELEGGARWAQIDSKTLAVDPRPNDKIVIRKAAMGSYLANIGRANAIRVRRIN
ncbi:MAG TPA: hypothetical protein VGB70_02385 [Allosphingosinicella sp.]|jgi:hypothetical protein